MVCSMTTTPFSFDIETAPQEGILESKFAPVFEELVFVPFNEESVKKYKKDSEEEYRERYIEAQGNHLKAWDEKKQKAADDFKEKQEKFVQECCLHAHLGRVLAIGLYDGTTFKALEGDESAMLRAFWLQYSACSKRQQMMVGHNVLNFDLPFLVNRSKILGVWMPGSVIIRSGKWLNWSQTFDDTASWWLLGRHHRDVKWSLDAVCHAFGLPGKQVEGVDGASFWKIYSSNRELAIEYLKNDCVQVFELYQKLCPPTI